MSPEILSANGRPRLACDKMARNREALRILFFVVFMGGVIESSSCGSSYFVLSGQFDNAFYSGNYTSDVRALDSCLTLCDSSCDCLGYAYDTNNSNCYIYSALTGEYSTYATTLFYLRYAAPPPLYPPPPTPPPPTPPPPLSPPPTTTLSFPPPPKSSPIPPNSSSGSGNIGPIIGGVVGGVFVLLLIGGALYYCFFFKKGVDHGLVKPFDPPGTGAYTNV